MNHYPLNLTAHPLSMIDRAAGVMDLSPTYAAWLRRKLDPPPFASHEDLAQRARSVMLMAKAMDSRIALIGDASPLHGYLEAALRREGVKTITSSQIV